jgi:hypothetical protein
LQAGQPVARPLPQGLVVPLGLRLLHRAKLLLQVLLAKAKLGQRRNCAGNDGDCGEIALLPERQCASGLVPRRTSRISAPPRIVTVCLLVLPLQCDMPQLFNSLLKSCPSFFQAPSPIQDPCVGSPDVQE